MLWVLSDHIRQAGPVNTDPVVVLCRLHIHHPLIQLKGCRIPCVFAIAVSVNFQAEDEPHTWL